LRPDQAKGVRLVAVRCDGATTVGEGVIVGVR